jgi:hypothetical protein
MTAMTLGALALLQEFEPLPASPPIGGWVWLYLIPALLLVVAFLATWGLYRRFAGKGDDQGRR